MRSRIRILQMPELHPILSTGVIAWSLGIDQAGATATAAGDKNIGIYADDVISWQ